MYKQLSYNHELAALGLLATHRLLRILPPGARARVIIGPDSLDLPVDISLHFNKFRLQAEAFHSGVLHHLLNDVRHVKVGKSNGVRVQAWFLEVYSLCFLLARRIMASKFTNLLTKTCLRGG
jgi:hypothetical protein